ncbi:MAG: 50S ribosomal protein L22 [Candidatus Diapherotrites archaeon]|nr:50S ribosomal protein L22 [Candidatus Diapherotrites archaeon]
MARKYSAQGIEGARAYGREMDISPKHAIEICREIRGKNVNKAITFLEKVIKKEAFVPFKRFNSKVAHRKGGKPGRYPVKASKAILKVLENAKANAENQGMDTDKLMIVHAAAHRGPVYDRRAPKGRMRTSAIETVNVEIIVKEA